MNRTVLIIGGTSGLGRSLAEIYCEENWTVGIIGRREDLLQDFQHKYPKNARICKLDIGTEMVSEKITAFIHQLGKVDLFIFTASIIHFNADLELVKEMKTLSVNIIGFTRVMNVAYDHCKKNNYGQIAVVTSIAQVRGNKIAPAYNASKAYQSNYTEDIRVKLK